MKIIQSPRFQREVKRFPKSVKKQLDSEIRKILENPEIGQEKKGDLASISVHKFRLKKIEHLLAYSFHNETLRLIMIGPHENYYRDLKRYLKS